MNTDPIADLLTRIRNAQKAHLGEIELPHSNVKEEILKVMMKYKFIENYNVEDLENNKKKLFVTLSEKNKAGSIKRISSPGQRLYSKSKDNKHIKSGLGIRILSTSKGIMSNVDAKKLKIGGEVLCELS